MFRKTMITFGANRAAQARGFWEKAWSRRCCTWSFALVVAGCNVLGIATIAQGAGPDIAVEMRPDRIFLGESVRYRVILQSGETAAEPKLTGFDDFEVQSLGGASQMQMTIIINGVKKTSGGKTYEYILTPKRAGELTVPGPAIEVDGKSYQGPTRKLVVEAPKQQDLAVLEMSVSRDHVYPMQPFTVKLNIAVKSLSEPNGESNPVSIQPQPPQLMIPWADDDRLPDGVEPRQSAGEWLRALLNGGRRPAGFAVNNIGTRGAFPDTDDVFSGGFPGFGSGSVFSMFQDERRARFLPQPKRTVREDLKGAKIPYWEFSFERTFTAKKIGEIAFGSVNLKGVFATGANTRGELTGERVYALADEVKIDVREPPAKDRPDSYVGAVGQFEAGAELNPTQVKVGDPMTFTMWLRGEGTLDSATAPKLDQIPGVATSFKVHDGSEETRDGMRRFTYSIRPRVAGIKEFPPVALAYFDYSKEQYVTLNTPAIPIEVAESTQLADGDIAMAAGTREVGSGPESRVDGIFANITDDSQLRDEAVRPERWFLTLAGMASAFLVTTVVTQQVRRRSNDLPGRRRRSALSRARQRWESARPHVTANSVRPAADIFSQAIIGWIADFSGVAEQGLTSGDAVQRLRDLGMDDALVARVAELLEQCDAVRYGAPQVPLTTLNEHTRGLLDDLSKAATKMRLN